MRANLDAADQGHQYYFDLLWRLGAEFAGNLTRALDQVPLSDIMVGFIADGIEDFCSVGKEAPKPIENHRFEVTRRDPTAL